MELVDLMMELRGGRPHALLARQFNLSKKRTRQVLDCVVPYLGDAVVRLMRAQDGLALLLDQLASERFERDLDSDNLFQDSRAHADGTGLLSLLLKNEATIWVISCIGAASNDLDDKQVRAMMPYIACLYMGALAKSAHTPLQRLAKRVVTDNQIGGHGARTLAQMVQAKRSAASARAPETPERKPGAGKGHGAIRDIIASLSIREREGENLATIYDLNRFRVTTRRS